MNSVDRILSKAFQENQIQGALLAVLLDGGRVISTGELSENMLSLIPGLIFFEKRSIKDPQALSRLSAKDLVFVENLTVDELWQLSKVTGAQIALISGKDFDPSLSDYHLQEKDLRGALLGLGSLWKQIEAAPSKPHLDGPRDQAGLFLDRDGVIVQDVDNLHDPKQVQIRSDVVPTMKKARELGYRIFVVTNQSGIGKGLFTWEQYEQVTFRMQYLLAQEGQFFDRIIKAPFHETSPNAHGLIRKSLRKPRPGMIHSIAAEFRIDLSKSIMVGDCARDLMSGALAGIVKVHLLKSHRTEEPKLWREWPLISRTEIDLNKVEISSLEEIFK